MGSHWFAAICVQARMALRQLESEELAEAHHMASNKEAAVPQGARALATLASSCAQPWSKIEP